MNRKGNALNRAPRLRRLRAQALASLAAIALVFASSGAPLVSAQAADPTTDTASHNTPALTRLFPREADVFVERDGLSFVSLPLDVLRESRADLSDVRIFNADGVEVPFLVNTSLPRRPPGAVERVPAQPIEVRQVRRKADDGATKKRERFIVEVPESAPRTGAWDLVLTSQVEHFVRRAYVREAGEKGKDITTASVFRLVSPLRERTRIPLPAGLTGRIEIALESEDDDTTYLEPTLVFEAAIARSASTPAVVPLAEIARSKSQGRTILTLSRPRGLVPSALRFETSTRTFYRPIEVSDDGAGKLAGRLVSAPIYRVADLPSVAELSVPLYGAQGDRLHIEVIDGDSPELGDLRVLAVVELPSLIFSLSPGFNKKPAGTLRFGGGRAQRPSYDLEGLRQAIGRADAERLADHLQDPREVPEARVGEVRACPLFDPSPALSFAMRAGAEVERRLYSHQMSVRVADAPEGVSRARLGLDVLAAARPDLADLRVIDEKNRQWPYLLEESAATELAPLVISNPLKKDRISRYTLTPKAAPQSIQEITLDIPADYLERDYRLFGKLAGGSDQLLLSGRFARRPGEARELSLTLPKERVMSLDLIVEDGDDAPLEIRGAKALIAVPDLYVVAPPGSYTLLAGLTAAAAPRYELAGARDLVLSVSAPASSLGALGPNPAFVPKPPPSFTESYALWAVLALAVVTLGALTLKLAHNEGQAGGAPKGDPPAKPAGSSPSAPAPDVPTAAPEKEPEPAKGAEMAAESAPSPDAPAPENELKPAADEPEKEPST